MVIPDVSQDGLGRWFGLCTGAANMALPSCHHVVSSGGTEAFSTAMPLCVQNPSSDVVGPNNPMVFTPLAAARWVRPVSPPTATQPLRTAERVAGNWTCRHRRTRADLGGHGAQRIAIFGTTQERHGPIPVGGARPSQRSGAQGLVG